MSSISRIENSRRYVDTMVFMRLVEGKKIPGADVRPGIPTNARQQFTEAQQADTYGPAHRLAAQERDLPSPALHEVLPCERHAPQAERLAPQRRCSCTSDRRGSGRRHGCIRALHECAPTHRQTSTPCSSAWRVPAPSLTATSYRSNWAMPKPVPAQAQRTPRR